MRPDEGEELGVGALHRLQYYRRLVAADWIVSEQFNFYERNVFVYQQLTPEQEHMVRVMPWGQTELIITMQNPILESGLYQPS